MQPLRSNSDGELLVAAIVHYGDLEPTRATVESVRRTYPPAEIWVVDNQGEARRRMGAPIGGVIDRWLEPGENLGYGGAIDLAASAALGEERFDAILALNNDVELAPGATAALLDELRLDRRTAAVTPRILRPGRAARIWYDGGSIDWTRGTGRVPRAGRPAKGAGVGDPHDVDFASGCVLLLRLGALAAEGGFDRRYFLYEEDVELSLRLRGAGWRLRHVPGATVHHAGQASQRGTGEAFRPLHDPRHPRLERLIELRVSNRLLTARRHARGTDRLRFCIGFPIYWNAKCLQATLCGRPLAWSALLNGLRRYRRLSAHPPDDALSGGESAPVV